MIEPEVEVEERTILQRRERATHVRISVYREEYELDRKTRIFLSHKGADKPRVVKYFALLKELGFRPWLDEEDLRAGTELHRGIREGFKDSCAAVFFITPNFVDERYLRTEVNYAMEEKTSKGDRFAIIALVFPDASGREGNVPDVLHQYTYKVLDNDLDAVRQVIRALPIALGLPDWRSRVTSSSELCTDSA